MDKIVVISLLLLSWITVSCCQQGKLEVSGSIHSCSSQSPSFYPGRMLWKGADFEGWNGREWMWLIGNTNTGPVTDIEGDTYQMMRVEEQEDSSYR